MFLGSYSPSFDKISRRVALPKKVRDYLAQNEVILSYGFEECIFGFDLKDWEKQSERELEKPIHDKITRDLRRFLFAGAVNVELDDQGRIVLPGKLLEYAKIQRPVIIGCGDHFEIWDEVVWEKYKGTMDKK